MTRHLTLLLSATLWLPGCSKELPPRSADEFVDNPILLEAAMVRCAQNRSKTRYEAACINAREAIDRISVKEEAARKVEMEARSEAKRRALRRTQEAAAYARQRAAETRALQQEADYLAQFGAAPAVEGAQLEETKNETTVAAPVGLDKTQTVTDGVVAPITVVEPELEDGTDLNAIRDELQRRNEADVD